jgi:hypothetical protein
MSFGAARAAPPSRSAARCGRRPPRRPASRDTATPSSCCPLSPSPVVAARPRRPPRPRRAVAAVAAVGAAAAEPTRGGAARRAEAVQVSVRRPGASAAGTRSRRRWQEAGGAGRRPANGSVSTSAGDALLAAGGDLVAPYGYTRSSRRFWPTTAFPRSISFVTRRVVPYASGRCGDQDVLRKGSAMAGS